MTPSPTIRYLLTSISGNCAVVCDCVSSPNCPSDYDCNDDCEIHDAVVSALVVKDFFAEGFWERLTVESANFIETVGSDTSEAGSIVSDTTTSLTGETLDFWWTFLEVPMRSVAPNLLHSERSAPTPM